MEEDVESSAGVRPGDVLAGKYRIERILGIGGARGLVLSNRTPLFDPIF